ncbi:hypothetical protein BGZ73_006351 [Actinomortierella ambigua]|nr:hypothetical protein BGZ73_006351 [Actinomortierella ambigua]
MATTATASTTPVKRKPGRPRGSGRGRRVGGRGNARGSSSTRSRIGPDSIVFEGRDEGMEVDMTADPLEDGKDGGNDQDLNQVMPLHSDSEVSSGSLETDSEPSQDEADDENGSMFRRFKRDLFAKTKTGSRPGAFLDEAVYDSWSDLRRGTLGERVIAVISEEHGRSHEHATSDRQGLQQPKDADSSGDSSHGGDEDGRSGVATESEPETDGGETIEDGGRRIADSMRVPKKRRLSLDLRITTPPSKGPGEGQLRSGKATSSTPPKLLKSAKGAEAKTGTRTEAAPSPTAASAAAAATTPAPQSVEIGALLTQIQKYTPELSSAVQKTNIHIPQGRYQSQNHRRQHQGQQTTKEGSDKQPTADSKVQHKTPSHFPGIHQFHHPMRCFYNQFSSLTRTKHCQYLWILNELRNGRQDQLLAADEKLWRRLSSQVEEERRQFQGWSHETICTKVHEWASSPDRGQRMRKNLEQTKWRRGRERVHQEYPRYYEFQQAILVRLPAVSAAHKGAVLLQRAQALRGSAQGQRLGEDGLVERKHVLARVGRICPVWMGKPIMQTDEHGVPYLSEIPLDERYWEQAEMERSTETPKTEAATVAPTENSAKDPRLAKVPAPAISKDTLLKDFMREQNADVSIASSTVLALARTLPSLGAEWEIPVRVELEEDATGNKKKRIYVDKPLIPKRVTELDMTQSFYNGVLKYLALCPSKAQDTDKGLPVVDQEKNDDQDSKMDLDLPDEEAAVDLPDEEAAVDSSMPPQKSDTVKTGGHEYTLWMLGDIRMIIRSRLHGFVANETRNQSMILKAILEYTPQLGMTEPRLSMVTSWWMAARIRDEPLVGVSRVDVAKNQFVRFPSPPSFIGPGSASDPFNPLQGIYSDRPVIAVKEWDRDLSEWTRPQIQLLHHILRRLSLLAPGQYLLTHKRGEVNASLYRAATSSGSASDSMPQPQEESLRLKRTTQSGLLQEQQEQTHTPEELAPATTLSEGTAQSNEGQTASDDSKTQENKSAFMSGAAKGAQVIWKGNGMMSEGEQVHAALVSPAESADQICAQSGEAGEAETNAKSKGASSTEEDEASAAAGVVRLGVIKDHTPIPAPNTLNATGQLTRYGKYDLHAAHEKSPEIVATARSVVVVGTASSSVSAKNINGSSSSPGSLPVSSTTPVLGSKNSGGSGLEVSVGHTNANSHPQTRSVATAAAGAVDQIGQGDNNNVQAAHVGVAAVASAAPSTALTATSSIVSELEELLQFQWTGPPDQVPGTFPYFSEKSGSQKAAVGRPHHHSSSQSHHAKGSWKTGSSFVYHDADRALGDEGGEGSSGSIPVVSIDTKQNDGKDVSEEDAETADNNGRSGSNTSTSESEEDDDSSSNLSEEDSESDTAASF